MDKQKIVIKFKGLSVATGLTILFMLLKLCGAIDWNWIWVFVPLWAPFFALSIVFLVASVMGAVMQLLKRNRY